MGRKSSWRNGPLKSISFPAIQEDLLREIARALDAASPTNFERFILDKDGGALSIAVTLSLIEETIIEAVPIAETSVAEVPDANIDSLDSLEFTPSIFKDSRTGEFSIESESPSIESESPSIESLEEQPYSLGGESVESSDGLVESIKSSDGLVESVESSAETQPNETLISLDIVPLEIAITPTHPAPEDVYLNPPSTTKSIKPFADQLYEAWLDSLPEAHDKEPMWGKPVLLEHLYQQHFSAILGMTFLRKVEQCVNNPGSGLRIHINLGGEETYKLKNGLTLEGISFSHTPTRLGDVPPSRDVSPSNSTRILSTIVLSVIGTCVVASSVLALIPIGGFRNGALYNSPAKHNNLPIKHK